MPELTNGYSPHHIQHTLHALNLAYNPEEIDALKTHYHALFTHWQNRQLPPDVIGLFVHAYHAQALLNGKVRKVVIYVVLGIDFEQATSQYKALCARFEKHYPTFVRPLADKSDHYLAFLRFYALGQLFATQYGRLPQENPMAVNNSKT